VFGDFYEEGRILGGARFRVYDGAYVIEHFGFSADLDVTRYRTDEPRPVFPGDGVMTLAETIEPGVARQVIEFTVGGASERAQPASHLPRLSMRACHAYGPGVVSHVISSRISRFISDPKRFDLS